MVRPACSAASSCARPEASDLGPSGGEPRGQRVDGAAHFVELADALRIEPGDFKAAAAAFGDQPLPVQQMQRVRHRLARDAELLRQLVLPDAVPRRQRAVDDRLEDPGIDLIDQVGERIQRDHAGRPFRNTEFRIRYSCRPGGRQPPFARKRCQIRRRALSNRRGQISHRPSLPLLTSVPVLSVTSERCPCCDRRSESGSSASPSGLIFLMAITSALSTVMTRKIAHQLDELSSKYVEAYGHLARMNVRSLEQALALRRMVIAKMQSPPDEAGFAERQKIYEAKGAGNRAGSASRARPDQCDHRRRRDRFRQCPARPDRRSDRERHQRSPSLSGGRIPAAADVARGRQFCGGQGQPGADRRAARRIQPEGRRNPHRHAVAGPWRCRW